MIFTWKTAVAVLLWHAACIIPAVAYNRPGCQDWPKEDEWQGLAQQLSDPSRLYGPFLDPAADYEQHCMQEAQPDFFDVLASGEGICMSNPACANQRCLLWEKHNLPAYSVEAHSVEDIQAALQFANEHDIAVSVKSSGHSFQSQSTHEGSLIIGCVIFP